MELNKNHRECLINDLDKAKEELDLQKAILNRAENDHLKEWNEIHIFLAEERIKLIERSLIENEIDF